MAINPNIALGVQQPHFNSPLDNFGKGLSLQHLMLQNAAAEGALADAPRLRQLAIEKSNLQMEQEKGALAEQARKRNVGIAKAMLAAPDKAGTYKQIVAWSAANGDKSLPPEWDDRMLPVFQALAAGEISADRSLEDSHFRDLANLEGTPAATTAAPVAPAPDFGAFNMPANAQSMGDVLPNLSASQERAAGAGQVVFSKNAAGKPALMTPGVANEQKEISQTGGITADMVGVGGITPDALRAKAAMIRTKGKTKEAYAYADKIEAEADKLDDRMLKEQQHTENVRLREEAIKTRLQGKGINVTQTTTKLADDFRQEPAVKDYRTVQPLVASMENAVGKDTAGSDLDMVYAIAKIFDPGSVVREGEQIMIRNAGGLPSVVQSALGFVIGGQRLSSSLRQEMLDQAHSRADNYKQAYDSAAKSYRDQATRWELNPDDIVRDYKVTARKVGDVVTKHPGPEPVIKWEDLK